MQLRLRVIAPVLLAGLLSPFTVCAQAYPSRLIRVVIPWPGGSNDAAGRLVFQRIAESVGQPVVIENRAGASGTIGAAFVALFVFHEQLRPVQWIGIALVAAGLALAVWP